MNSSRLDRLITIEQPSNSVDDFGGNGLTTWASIGRVWAKMETGLSSESVAADRVESSYPVRWTIRYTTTIDETMRVSYDGKYFHIKGIREITRRHLMELQTEEVK